MISVDWRFFVGNQGLETWLMAFAVIAAMGAEDEIAEFSPRGIAVETCPFKTSMEPRMVMKWIKRFWDVIVANMRASD